MKTILICLTLSFQVIFAYKGLAQSPVCPYPIANNMKCTINITYVIYSNGVACTPVNTNITAGNSINVPCAAFTSCGTGNFDIEITINSINGVNVPNPQTVSMSVQGPLYFGPCSGDPNIPQSCYVGCNENIDWNSTGANIY